MDRDFNGLVLAAATEFPVMTASTVMAEALALRWVVSLSIQLGFRRIWLVTDWLQLFQRWKAPPDESSYLSAIIHDCFFFFVVLLILWTCVLFVVLGTWLQTFLPGRLPPTPV